MTVENKDAVSNAPSDSDMFLANHLELVNTTDGSTQSIDYFSEAWWDWYTIDGQPLMLFPGNSDTNYVAFGFYVDEYLPDGTPVDFSSFCIRGTEDSQNSIIPLELNR